VNNPGGEIMKGESLSVETDSHRGGDIIFTAGRAYRPPDVPPARHGDIVFCTEDGGEMLRLCGDGDIRVKGEVVYAGPEVVAAFRAWLGLEEES